MLVALIRPAETRNLTVTGPTRDDLHRQVQEQLPDGWDIAKVPPVLNRDGTFTADAMIVRRDDVREIEAGDMNALHAKVPGGWQVLSVRRV